MNGIVLFDRDLDETHSSKGNEEVLFTSETGGVKIKFFSSGTLERAIKCCEQHGMPLHILVTRWFGSKDAFAKHVSENETWWYDKLYSTKVNVTLHLSKRLYHHPDGFLDRMARESLDLTLPTRMYLGRERAMRLQDIQTMLLTKGWLTVSNESLC